MEPLAMFGLGVPELLIILAVVLLLFGGSRLAGLGKSSGRALKEFKEETRSLKPEDQPTEPAGPATPPMPQVSAEPPAGPAYPPPSTYQQQPPTYPAANPANPDAGDLRKDV